MKKVSLILSAVVMTAMVVTSCGGGKTDASTPSDEDVKEVDTTEQMSNSDMEGYKFELLPMEKVSSPEDWGGNFALMNYRIVLRAGNEIIDTFEDTGDGYLSEEGDFVSIRTEAGSERTYSFEELGANKIIGKMNFFYEGESNEVWKRTYQKWAVVDCNGDCE